MTTLIATAELDMAAYEFEISCFHPQCSESAIVMCKGCSDRCPVGVCEGHFKEVGDRFEGNFGKQCKGCLRPLVAFEHHYSVIPL